MASNDDLESKSLQELRSICRDLKINSGGTKVTLKRRITAKRTKNRENVMNMRDKIDGVGEYGTDNDDAAGDSAGGGGEDGGEDDGDAKAKNGVAASNTAGQVRSVSLVENPEHTNAVVIVLFSPPYLS